MIKLYDKPIRVNKSSQDRNSVDVGANLFVGNLDPDVDEKLLYDTFSAFGLVITTPKIMRDPDTGTSRGFGFVSFQNFESSDAAIESMNGQFLCNRPVTVTYAFKKDSRGEGANDASGVCIRPDWMSTPLAPVVRLLLTYRVVHHTQHRFCSQVAQRGD